MTDIGFFSSQGARVRGASRADNAAAQGRRSRRTKLRRSVFLGAAIAADVLVVIFAMVLAKASYDWLVFDTFTVESANIRIGMFAAVLFASMSYWRYGYSVADYLEIAVHGQRIFVVWNSAFLAAAAVGFLTKTIGDSSRGTFLLFYFVGLLLLLATRALMVRATTGRAKLGQALSSTAFIVGFSEDIEQSRLLEKLRNRSVSVPSVYELSDDPIELQMQLGRVIASARRKTPDDIYIVSSWAKPDVIDACASAFMRVPSAIHLHVDPSSPLNRFVSAEDQRAGRASLRLKAHAMSQLGQLLKRLFDIGASATALLLLAPLLALVALAIRIDSKGPALFRQKRHGFNKSTFDILKFRSMHVRDEGMDVRQATLNDDRITRIGRLLRRFNIDELPQLINVLRGEMSLVGPRPHAMAHDTAFEREVELYARRHNVKPGITGWAQVNGYRGETDTPEKIMNRVQHDLYYIDNWSFMLDLWIVFLTVFSPTAYANAR